MVIDTSTKKQYYVIEVYTIRGIKIYELRLKGTDEVITKGTLDNINDFLYHLFYVVNTNFIDKLREEFEQ